MNKLTINGYKRGLRWSQIRADYSMPAEIDILRRGAIYAESNEMD